VEIVEGPEFLGGSNSTGKVLPEQFFLTAQLGRAPSLAWRSIHTVRGVLEGGLRWRVGNGESIHIWGDKWLPSSLNFQVQSPVNTINPNARVCSLINQETRWWDVPLVQMIFSPEEAEAICGMPLSFLRKPDILIWNGTKHGSFTVRSAYHLELARRARDRGENSRSQEVSGV
jgi:hypothetical protein